MPTSFNFTIPDNAIDADALRTKRNFSADLFEHRNPLTYAQNEAGVVASETLGIHIARKAGQFLAVEVMPIVVPTSGSYTVDVQKGNAATAFATILSAVVTVDNTSVDRTIQVGTISTSTFAAGDAIRIVVTASTPTGSAGVIVTVTTDEDSV